MPLKSETVENIDEVKPVIGPSSSAQERDAAVLAVAAEIRQLTSRLDILEDKFAIDLGHIYQELELIRNKS